MARLTPSTWPESRELVPRRLVGAEMGFDQCQRTFPSRFEPPPTPGTRLVTTLTVREGREGDDVAQRKAISKKAADTHVVIYRVGAQTYQIDTSKQKVYRQFVEIETSRAFEIYASWRAAQATA